MIKIIGFKKMKLLKNCKEKLENKYLKDKKYHKLRDHCYYTVEYRGAAHGICNLKHNVPEKIFSSFHNGSNCDNHFITKELTEEFEKQFTCLEGNTKECITSIVSIEKKLAAIDKNGEEVTKNISYILQFIDSARFMASTLSYLLNNISEGIHKVKCKYGHNEKNVKLVELDSKNATGFFEHVKFKDHSIE